ncbi:hypothetical protein WJX84_010047 [Apatococcus fuscideae]|uniref:Glycosyl hydrolase family 43 n=1 Tax=Apatococcus fuscideae TaxID=2026836 RepID=A0AAW1SQZ6_9CHLO
MFDRYLKRKAPWHNGYLKLGSLLAFTLLWAVITHNTHPTTQISSPLLQGLGDRRMLAAYDGWSGLEGTPIPGEQREVAAVRSGDEWHDTSGNVIQAHGGSMLEHEGVFYWYGEKKDGLTYNTTTNGWQRVDVLGISCYSSSDLVSWKSEGLALKPNDHPDLAAERVAERPRVLYNKATKLFVMWLHIDDQDYKVAAAGVAVSDQPQGPFSYRGSFRPHGNEELRDFTLFKDEDEKAYLAYSSEGNKVLHLGPLAPDYLTPLPPYQRLFPGQAREAPAIFKSGDLYLMFTSGCTFWEPNPAEVFCASDLAGPWLSLGNPCMGNPEERRKTFRSQDTHVVPLLGKPDTFLLMADRWNHRNLGDSRYIWLPMSVRDRRNGTAAETPSWAEKVGSVLGIVPRPSVDVVVRWEDAWQPLQYYALSTAEGDNPRTAALPMALQQKREDQPSQEALLSRHSEPDEMSSVM